MNKITEEKSIYIVGVDGSGIENLSQKEKNLISSIKKIAVPNRLLNSTKEWLKLYNPYFNEISIFPTDKPKDLINWLKELKGKIVVIASGDPLWYGIGRVLLDVLPKDQLYFYPHLSSMQIAFARIKKPWQDVTWVSLHGRDQGLLIKKLQERPNSLAVLVDPNRGGAEEVRQILNDIGLQYAYEFWICQNLGHKEEKIFQINPKKPIFGLNSLHLVLLLAKSSQITDPNSLPIIGIPDGIFAQHEDKPGLMTKKEIRVQILSELELPEEGVLWDIGAGVGSIGLEAIRLRPKTKLLAIEKRYGSKDLINKNSNLLGVKAELIIEEDALHVLGTKSIPSTLSSPDRIIIGGGGNNKIKLINEAVKALKKQGIIIIPLASIEAIYEIKSFLHSVGLSATISQHQNWRGISLGKGTRLAPQNPVFILKIKKNQINTSL